MSAAHACRICRHFWHSDWSRIQDSPWSRFPNMPLPIPCVLELTFFRRGARHQLFVAYSVHGQQFVCLNIQTFVDIWSGWHGAWKHNGDILDVELYYQEKISLFKFHRAGQCYNLAHAGESISASAHMTMLPMTQNQIADISYHLSQCAARDSLRWHSVSQDLCGVAMSVPGFLVFDLENWCDFHCKYNEKSTSMMGGWRTTWVCCI